MPVVLVYLRYRLVTRDICRYYYDSSIILSKVEFKIMRNSVMRLRAFGNLFENLDAYLYLVGKRFGVKPKSVKRA